MLFFIRNTALSNFWATHVRKITTNHSMEKFFTFSDNTEAEVTFSRHSLWGFLDAILDDSESIGDEDGVLSVLPQLARGDLDGHGRDFTG
ncbi:hypothetical protein PGQ11_013463 [Apiospora arundinis]|uniref:Uncharacterized protein n=1 Tax=Apiospora arundinis TaxID=335852 RepID=A0ABR2HQ33_9PEZI